MMTALVNRALDFAFAVYTIRVLGPIALGRYTWAVLVVGYFDIFVNFGLGVLITRGVARDYDAAPRYLGGALMIRAALWLGAIACAATIAGPLASQLELTPDMRIALVALTVGIGISNLTGVVSALFTAHELMEYPAGLSVLTTLIKLTLGVAVLSQGAGIVGLALVSIVTNAITAIVLVSMGWHRLGALHVRWEARTSVDFLSESFPLLLNNLLATLFFRVDGLMLRAWAGDTVLGWYSTAYKFVDGFGIVPSSITLAAFPVLARLARPSDLPAQSSSTSNELAPAMRRALRLLQSAAWPLAVTVTLAADPIIRAFAGDRFLPHAAIALQILVWFAPLSFINSFVQYVLIAAGHQRIITLGFVVATSFNIVANALVIPHWSYIGAAVVTVLSELVLLGPFYWGVHRYVGELRLLSLSWRPALAAGFMVIPLMLMMRLSWLGAIPVAFVCYGGVLLFVGGVPAEDRQLLQTAFTSLRGVRQRWR